MKYPRMKLPLSVMDGLRFGEFEALPKLVKKRLIKLMSRISEASYRRGAQQAMWLPFEHECDHKWRFSNLSKSKGIDKPRCKYEAEMTSAERFDIEYGDKMRQIGFD